MEIVIEKAQGRVPVTVVKIAGKLDGSTYESLIAKAKELVGAGAVDVLIDLSATDYMSTAGLVALQSIARLLRGEALADPDHGWEAIRGVAREGMGGKQKHFKLLNPTPKILATLETTGLKDSFEVFANQDEAIKSF